MTIEISGSVPHLPRREIEAFVSKVLRAFDHPAPGGLSLAFVDDATMRRLNRRFRQKDKTTDVLTFESEIVISVDQARRQASEEGHSLTTEIRYLLLHGILHSFGYDHETDQGEMNELEHEVRAKVGLE